MHTSSATAEAGIGERGAAGVSRSIIDEKARELCEAIAEDDGFQQAQEQVRVFLDDVEARSVYSQWQQLGQELHRKHHAGSEPTPAEIAEFERLKASVAAHPVAGPFLEADSAINSIFADVTKRVQKTLQLGRAPTEEELADEGCCGGHGGGGCGCH